MIHTLRCSGALTTPGDCDQGVAAGQTGSTGCNLAELTAPPSCCNRFQEMSSLQSSHIRGKTQKKGKRVQKHFTLMWDFRRPVIFRGSNPSLLLPDKRDPTGAKLLTQTTSENLNLVLWDGTKRSALENLTFEKNQFNLFQNIYEHASFQTIKNEHLPCQVSV